mmetsp:Transcript_32213/g.73045  ORF Transcript_32213/g.73045 Transcript_32213/m.73045 type:complete len:114 (-) Transcript_32213:33-374(-)
MWVTVPVNAPAPSPIMPLIQTFLLTSATVLMSSFDMVSGGVNALLMLYNAVVDFRCSHLPEQSVVESASMQRRRLRTQSTQSTQSTPGVLFAPVRRSQEDGGKLAVDYQNKLG